MFASFNFAKKYQAYSLGIGAVLLLSAAGCQPSSTAGAPANKLTAHEQGTIAHFRSALNSYAKEVKYLNKELAAAEKAKSQRNYGIADSHYAEANKILYKRRAAIINRPESLEIVWPESMYVLRDALRTVRDLKYALPQTGSMNDIELNRLLSAMREVVVADERFYQGVVKRKRNPDKTQYEGNMMVSIAPFPFAVGIFDGEFKIRQRFQFGLSSTVFSISEAPAGVTTLRIIHGNQMRIYSIGNRTLTLDLPASLLHVDGRVMTITSKI